MRPGSRGNLGTSGGGPPGTGMGRPGSGMKKPPGSARLRTGLLIVTINIFHYSKELHRQVLDYKQQQVLRLMPV